MTLPSQDILIALAKQLVEIEFIFVRKGYTRALTCMKVQRQSTSEDDITFLELQGKAASHLRSDLIAVTLATSN
jgi:hypothetical protein